MTRDLVKEIIAQRKLLGWSQRDLAEKCELPQSTIGRLESNKVIPNLQTIEKITEVLGLELCCQKKDTRPEYIKKWDGLEFTCYWKDEPVSEVHISKLRASIKRFVKHPVKQLFPDEETDVYRLSEILKSRCWQEDRADIDAYLKKLGLTYYDPLEIVKKTHGVSYNDFLWFQFRGENLSWNKVAPKRFRNV